MRSRAALLVAAVAVVLVAVADRRTSIGPVIVLWFLVVVPGAAASRLLGFPPDGDGGAGGGAASWAVAIGASFAVDALVSEAMVYARVWTPARALIVLAALVFALVGADWMVRRRRARLDAVRSQLA